MNEEGRNGMPIGFLVRTRKAQQEGRNELRRSRRKAAKADVVHVSTLQLTKDDGVKVERQCCAAQCLRAGNRCSLRVTGMHKAGRSLYVQALMRHMSGVGQVSPFEGTAKPDWPAAN